MEEVVFIKEYGRQTFETSVNIKKLKMFEEKCKPGDLSVDTNGDAIHPMVFTFMTMKCPNGTFEKFKEADQKNGNKWSEYFPDYSSRSFMDAQRISGENQQKALGRLYKASALSRRCQIM